MKKVIFITIFSLLAVNANAQKKKYAKSTKPKKEVLMKVDNFSAELIPVGKEKKMVVFVKNDNVTDTLSVKTVPSNFKPINFLMKPVTVKGTKLCYLTWQEQQKTEAKLKKETIDITESQIWNPNTKLLLIGNTHKNIHIKETQFLDRNKTASQDVERKRSEGFQFEIKEDGSAIMKTKTQQTVYIYNPSLDKYEPQQPKVKSSSKKRR